MREKLIFNLLTTLSAVFSYSVSGKASREPFQVNLSRHLEFTAGLSLGVICGKDYINFHFLIIGPKDMKFLPQKSFYLPKLIHG